MSGGIFSGTNVLGAVDIREGALPCDWDTLAAFGVSQGYDIFYFDADPFIAGEPKLKFASNQYAHAFSSQLCSFVKWDGKLWVRDLVMNQVLADWPKPAVIPPTDKPKESPGTATGPLPPPPDPIPPGEEPGTAKAGMGIGAMAAIGVAVLGLGWLFTRKKK